MKKTLLEKVKHELLTQGLEMRTAKSRTWLKAKMRQLKGDAVTPILDNPRRTNLKSRIEIGRMYFYIYDPKTKDTLPYYDIFPLVIPIEPYNDGFLGLNLHYIDPVSRLNLLDSLYTIATNTNFDARTRLKISYQLLNSSSKYFQAMPCIKRYLYSQFESPFLEVPADEWEIAAMLPVAGFVKAKESKVWKDSRKKF